MYGDTGVRRSWLATSVIGMRVRSAARKRMSLMTAGHASASTQMCIVSPALVDSRAGDAHDVGPLAHLGGDEVTHRFGRALHRLCPALVERRAHIRLPQDLTDVRV